MAGSKVTPEVSVQISANIVKFLEGIKNSITSIQGFQKLLKNIAGAVGIGFGTQQIVSFGLEVAKLGGEFQSVQGAFKRLGDSAALMQTLKQVTGDTVSELDLMKRTVQAANFGISLKQLPELLKFATLRAQQTGQSVDYLVESIIMGIGRKSPMILDNLGISLLRIREKLKGVGTEAASVGDFTRIIGEIAKEELGKMPGFADNAATSLQRISSAWMNIKTSIGQSDILESNLGAISSFMTMLSNAVSDTADEVMRIDQAKLSALIESITDSNTPLDERKKLIKLLQTEYPNFLKNINAEKVTNEQLRDRLIDVNEQFEQKIKLVAQEEILAKFQKKINDGLSKELELRQKIKLAEAELRELGPESTTQTPGMSKQALIGFTIGAAKAGIKDIQDERKILKDQFKAYSDELKILLADFSKIKNNFFSLKTKEDGGGVSKMSKEQENYLEKIRKKTLEIKSSFYEFAKSLEEAEKQANILQETLNKVFYKRDIKDAIKDMVPDKMPKPVGKDFTKNLEEQEKLLKKNTDAAARYQQNIENLKVGLQRAARQGLDEFAEGLQQVFAGDISFGDNLLRAIAKFSQEFGKQLILIGAGRIAVGDYAKGALAVAAGTALIAGGAYIQRGVSNRMELSNAKSVSIESGRRNNEIVVTGQLVGSGRDLVAVINNTQFDNSIRKGG